MRYFNNPQTLEELKKQYKKLAMQHHPDVGGSVEKMQEINAEYDKLFAALKNIRRTADGKTYTSQTENTESANDFKKIINKLINLKGINIEICGSWLWVTGDTYRHRNTLKSLKFRFSKSKTAWYFHNEEYRKNHGKVYSLDEIRDLYGSETIKAEPQLKLSII